MLKNRGRSVVGLLCSIALMGTAGCTVTAEPSGGNPDGTITIQNDSSYVLIGLYVVPVYQNSWGPNLVYDDLFPTERITIDVACASYDVMVTDERRRDCVLGNLDLCFTDQLWVISNSTLRNCGY